VEPPEILIPIRRGPRGGPRKLGSPPNGIAIIPGPGLAIRILASDSDACEHQRCGSCRSTPSGRAMSPSRGPPRGPPPYRRISAAPNMRPPLHQSLNAGHSIVGMSRDQARLAVPPDSVVSG